MHASLVLLCVLCFNCVVHSCPLCFFGAAAPCCAAVFAVMCGGHDAGTQACSVTGAVRGNSGMVAMLHLASGLCVVLLLSELMHTGTSPCCACVTPYCCLQN